MTVCRVLFYGLKACDLSSSTSDTGSETPGERQHSLIPATSPKLMKSKPSSATMDFLHIDIKPLATPTSSRSSISSDTSHESSPMRVMIRETSRGRHRICVSQTLLRTHTGGGV